MKVAKQLNVSVQQFYDFVCKMVIKDISSVTKSEVDISQLKDGYSYNKTLMNKMGKLEIVKTCIEKINASEYTVSFKSKYGVNILSYSYRPLENDSIMVEYNEDYIGTNSSTSLSYNLLSFVSSYSHKKRMKKLLTEIENIILKQAY